MLFPNNDGIHINCSRNVTMSDCNITSHSGGIRIGWINGGAIRNCTFSNLTMTDTNVGIDLVLPGNPTGVRLSDEGEEATHVENLNFSNITMDRVFYEPASVRVEENCRCDCIRNLYFYKHSRQFRPYARYHWPAGLPCSERLLRQLPL